MDPAESPSVNISSTTDKPNWLRRLYNIDPHISKRNNKNCNNFFCKWYAYWKLQIAINFKELTLYFLMMQKKYLSIYLREVNLLSMKSSTIGKGKYYSLSMWE